MTFLIWKDFYLQDLKAAEERRDKKIAREVECLEKEKQLNKLKVKRKFGAYVAVPGRNRALFCCVFLPHYRIRSAVAQYFH